MLIAYNESHSQNHEDARVYEAEMYHKSQLKIWSHGKKNEAPKIQPFISLLSLSSSLH